MIKALNYLITALACNKFWPAIQDHSIAATIVNASCKTFHRLVNGAMVNFVESQT
jgi:hypothetical protein